jgi:hypothetical protein
VAKRQFTRINLAMKAKIISGEVTLGGLVKNISLNGALISLVQLQNVGLKVGQEVGLVLTLMDGKSNVDFKLRGKIVRLQAGAIAVMFSSEKMEIGSLLLLRKIVVGGGVPLKQAHQECLAILNTVGFGLEDLVE